MALKSTMYKFDLQVTDFNRDHFQAYELNVALHPSEKVERMLIRLIAFSYFANERLLFTKGLSTDDEPDLWQKSLSDEIELWLDLGLPDERRLKRAASRAQQLAVFAYGGQKVGTWLSGLEKNKLDIDKLKVYIVDDEPLSAVSDSLSRNAKIDCMIQDNDVTLTVGEIVLNLKVEQVFLT